MLPRKIFTKKTKWLWVGLLALAPLAGITGVWLALRYDPHVRLRLGVDRAMAVAAAAQYAAARGMEVTGWTNFCRFKYDNDLFFFYRTRTGAERDRAQELAPEAGISVLFRAPDRSEIVEVELSHKGEPLGFRRRLARPVESNDPGPAAARQVAEEALRARLAQVGLATPDLQLSGGGGEGAAFREYKWRWPLASLPELKVESLLVVHYGVLIADQVEADLDDKAVWPQSRAVKITKGVNIALYSLLLFVVVVYGLYRFVRRAQQREVSYSRALLLGGIFAAVMAAFVLIVDTALYETNRNPGFPVPDWMILFSGSMVYAVLGLFMGLAYGAGEGDIREAYPGKLTSLDALIMGRIFSRNVARAVLIGCAIGGWVLLGTQLAFLYWQGRPGMGEELNELANAWIGRAPLLAPFLAWPMDVILIAVAGLLIPLPFLHRRRRLRRWALPILAVLAWIACAGPFYGFRPWYPMLLMAAVRTGFLLLAFLQFDLLTAITALAFPTFITFAASLAAQPVPSLQRAGLTSLVLALTGLAAAIFFAVKGRHYREEEVRPVYAKHLAERLSMQAEVSAAREAQLRLMSNELPKTNQFAIAASCLPAFEVGGDFYDVYELEPGKLGVLIAEGGGRGLGSALAIAYAKGFLMPKILGNGRRDDAPAEIIRGLQEQLTGVLADEANLEIAYAVIDAADGQLRYARTGAHPAVLVGRGGEANSLVNPEESVLKFKAGRGANGDLTVISGEYSLAEGDGVIFYTDGLSKDWAEQGSSPEQELAKVLRLSQGKAADELQQALTKNVSECARHARKQGLEDDLTAVIVRLEPIVGAE